MRCDADEGVMAAPVKEAALAAGVGVQSVPDSGLEEYTVSLRPPPPWGSDGKLTRGGRWRAG